MKFCVYCEKFYTKENGLNENLRTTDFIYLLKITFGPVSHCKTAIYCNHLFADAAWSYIW